MKIYVNMKCPDALDYAIEQACEGEVGGPSDSEEHDMMYDDMVESVKKLASRWFAYGEYVTLCIDTENETCTVVE